MQELIIVRGGGDIASGTIYRLFQCGYPVLVLESARPAAIRRKVAFCEAVYDGEAAVEDLTAVRICEAGEYQSVVGSGRIPLLVDEKGEAISLLKPSVVVDAILAKRNLGTIREMAPLTIGLGPGFTAGADVDYVVETMRGHNLGRIISRGSALPNTGVPGLIGGMGAERVIHSPASGIIAVKSHIGDWVSAGQVLAMIGEVPVTATITGVLRGMIRDGFEVKKGLKIADIDPRQEQKDNCYTISDKARCIAGSVLEVIISRGIR